MLFLLLRSLPHAFPWLPFSYPGHLPWTEYGVPASLPRHDAPSVPFPLHCERSRTVPGYRSWIRAS